MLYNSQGLLEMLTVLCESVGVINMSQDSSFSFRGNSAAGSALPSKPPWLESSKKKDKPG